MSAAKSFRAVIAGTGFDGRMRVIQRFCRIGALARIIREPSNPHDANAIRVDLQCRILFNLVSVYRHIGYIPAARAARIASKIDNGEMNVLGARIVNMDAPDWKHVPDVTVEVDFEAKLKSR